MYKNNWNCCNNNNNNWGCGKSNTNHWGGCEQKNKCEEKKQENKVCCFCCEKQEENGYGGCEQNNFGCGMNEFSQSPYGNNYSQWY